MAGPWKSCAHLLFSPFPPSEKQAIELTCLYWKGGGWPYKQTSYLTLHTIILGPKQQPSDIHRIESVQRHEYSNDCAVHISMGTTSSSLFANCSTSLKEHVQSVQRPVPHCRRREAVDLRRPIQQDFPNRLLPPSHLPLSNSMINSKTQQ